MNAEPQKPLQAPKPPQTISMKKLVTIFAVAFAAILLILNAPTLIKAISYPFTHSATADNEQLTNQYRDIYGYEKHPELITAVQNQNAHAPAPSIFPIAPGQYTQAGFQAELSIPKIGVTAPVLQVSDSNDATVLGALKKGVVLYPGSANPGQPGTTVIIGHSSSDLPWTKYSAIFSLLDKLQPNDLIYVTVNGTQYIYRVRAVQKGSAQQLIDSGLAGDLIVSTCWPIGTDAKRIAVSASLVQ
jgi:LPXTG-site transpeptidase (sortase) family protein